VSLTRLAPLPPSQEFGAWFFAQDAEAQEHLLRLHYEAKDGTQQDAALSDLPALLEARAITSETQVSGSIGIRLLGSTLLANRYQLCSRKEP
jgi:hypothetical protein